MSGFFEGGEPVGFEFFHAERADLDDEVVGILVDDESREAVGFGEDLAKGVGLRFEGFAEGESLGDSSMKEGLVDRLLAEGEQFDGEPGGIVVGADAEEVVLVVEEGDELAVFDAERFDDLLFLNPGIAVSDLFVSAWFEAGGSDRFHSLVTVPAAECFRRADGTNFQGCCKSLLVPVREWYYSRNGQVAERLKAPAC